MRDGGIQHSGSRPSARSSLRCRESVLSVFACRLRPRAKAVSAGSATCAVTPAAASSSATYRHPVHPSSANATSFRPANRASQDRRCARPQLSLARYMSSIRPWIPDRLGLGPRTGHGRRGWERYRLTRSRLRCRPVGLRDKRTAAALMPLIVSAVLWAKKGQASRNLAHLAARRPAFTSSGPRRGSNRPRERTRCHRSMASRSFRVMVPE